MTADIDRLAALLHEMETPYGKDPKCPGLSSHGGIASRLTAAGVGFPDEGLREAAQALVDLWDTFNFPYTSAFVPTLDRLRAALAATPAPAPLDVEGTLTACPLVGVHAHSFRGPHRFREWEPGS
jgi:hypothetical protein